MIGQGVYVKSSSPPPPPGAPHLDACNTASEVLAFCSSFNNTATTTTPAPAAPPPAAGEPRRLLKAPHPTHILKCPRCASLDTKFCYYNNYSLSQPRYFCKNCKRYWTAGGVLRNVPVGGGLRKNKRCKLKLAAEVEAATAAARESSTPQQHLEDKPSSPLQVASSSAAMGSSTTSTNSSVVTGRPANFPGVMLPTFLCSRTPTSTHLPRTSSGSDASTIDCAGNDNCTASVTGRRAGALLLEHHQNGNQMQHFFGDVHASGMRPQFYASYGTSLASSCSQQYSDEEGGKTSHYTMGYGSAMGMEQVVGSNHGDCTVSRSYNAMVGKSCEGGGHDFSDNPGSIKNEKEDIISSNPTYDCWQLISDSLFNGGGTESFLPLPGASWSDFSQFHDPDEPG